MLSEDKILQSSLGFYLIINFGECYIVDIKFLFQVVCPKYVCYKVCEPEIWGIVFISLFLRRLQQSLTLMESENGIMDCEKKSDSSLLFFCGRLSSLTNCSLHNTQQQTYLASVYFKQSTCSPCTHRHCYWLGVFIKV